MSAVGFDIGSENSCIAVVKSGGIEVLDNEFGSRNTSTYVAFTNENRQIGDAARNETVININNTVFGFKRLLGKLEDFEIAREQAYLPLEIRELQPGNIGFKVNYLKSECVFSVVQLTAMFLTKLKMTTEAKLGCLVHDCVISVPYFYSDAQRRAMLNAAKIATLNPLKIINEPSAIALCYGFFKNDLSEENPANVVFIDFGHTALTVSVFAITKCKAKMIKCVWEHVGGRDFDDVLVRHFVEDLKNRYQLDVLTSKKALMSLVRECEFIKKLMSSSSQEIHFHIESIMQDRDVCGSTNREFFERISQNILKRVKSVFLRILEETPLQIEDIHSVETIGGTSRMPAVKRLVGEVFKLEASTTLNQDEAVSRGCALQYALLSPALKTRNFVVEDRPPYLIKIKWKNHVCQVEEVVVFSLSDALPAFKLIEPVSMSKPFSIEALYSINNSEDRKIGSYKFGNVPPEVEASGVMKVKIKACLNLHGIFSLMSAKIIRKKSGIGKIDEEEVKIENDVKTPEDISEDDVIKQEGQSGFLLKLHELTIDENVFGVSSETFNDYIKTEQTMIRNDFENKEKADTRNAVEEYIYGARGSLNTELEKYVEGAVRKSMLDFLSETESWLEDNQNLQLSVYSRKLNELKTLIEPIKKRYVERKQASSVINEYSEMLVQASDAISNSAKCYNSKDFEKLHKMLQGYRDYLDHVINYFSDLPLYEDLPPSFKEKLNSSLSSFQKEYLSEFSSLQNKIESEIESGQHSGDGASDEMKPVEEKESQTEKNKDAN